MFEQDKYMISYLLKDNNNLLKLIKKNKKIKWSKKIYNLKELENLCQLNLNKKKYKIAEQIRATYIEKFKPLIKINKVKYSLLKKKI